MDILVQLNNQTAGRDAIVRLLQYTARAGWYYSQSSPTARHSSDVLKSLEYTFSSFRKLLRLGRCLDSLYSVLKAAKHPDLTLRITITMTKIFNAFFLFADHMTWIGRVGVTRVNLEKWNSDCNRYWLLTIIMNLTRDMYEIIGALERINTSQITRLTQGSKNRLAAKCHNFMTLVHRTDIFLDTLKNSCDIFIPLTALGYTKLSPGVIGILGTVSSAIGLYCLINPMFKLPS